MRAVLDGHRAWPEIASDIVELMLVALGLPRDEAHALANAEPARLAEAGAI